MKKLFSLVAAMIIAATTFAQVDEVTLTVLGTGRTEDEATNIALRSAIEQSFGTFVSANTTILNDQLVRDEIVSVSKGNIKNYDKLSVSSLPNGQVGVSLRATVAVNKLISYAKSKGSRAEFAGQAYTANVKLIKLKAESTKKAIDIMLSQMELLINDMFDFDLTIGELYMGKIYTNLPKESKEETDCYILPCQIDVYANVASTNFANMYFNTLKSLALSEEEIRLCSTNNVPATKVLNLLLLYKTGPASDVLLDLKDKYNSLCVIPLSVEDNVSLHQKLLQMCYNAMRRFQIQEIGTRNTFERKERKGSTSTKDFVGIESCPSAKALAKDQQLLYSKEEQKYIIPSFKGGANFWNEDLNKLIVPITTEQTKSSRRGSYTPGEPGKTILGKQEKLVSINVKLYKEDLSFFKGYELKGVSAPQNK